MSEQPKSLPTLIDELRDLVVTYAKEQTVDDLRGLGRFVGFGLAASFAGGIGFVLLILGGLRALQTETGTTFRGNWSWAPYGIALLACLVIAGYAVSRVGKGKR